MTAFKAGDVVLIGPECSVQFSGDRALRLRLVSIGAVDAYHGWLWLTGYVLDAKGMATDKREVYVRSTGIMASSPSSPSVRRTGRKVAGPGGVGDAVSAAFATFSTARQLDHEG